MRDPSGEKSGWPSNFSRPVSARTAPEATETMWTREVSKSPECGVSTRVKAIDDPSGDQDSGDAGGPVTYADPSFRRTLSNAIGWAAAR